jgi:hypothetical protein
LRYGDGMRPAHSEIPDTFRCAFIAGREVTLTEHQVGRCTVDLRDRIPHQYAAIPAIRDEQMAIVNQHAIAPMQRIGARCLLSPIGAAASKIDLPKNDVSGLIEVSWQPMPQQHAMIPGISHGKYIAGNCNARRYVEGRGPDLPARIPAFRSEVRLSNEEIRGRAIAGGCLAPGQNAMVARIAHKERTGAMSQTRAARSKKRISRWSNRCYRTIDSGVGSENDARTARVQQCFRRSSRLRARTNRSEGNSHRHFASLTSTRSPTTRTAWDCS